MATHDPRPDLLRRQVASLRAQTEPDWMCLVLDDASRDRRAVAEVFTDERFRVLPPEPRLGAYRAFEHLVGVCEEDLPVLLCDQDDYWHPDKLARMLSQPGAAVFSAMRVVDDRGYLVRERFLPHPPTAAALTPASLLLMNSVSGTALLISPEVRAASLPFPAPGLRGWHDQWLAAVAARIGTLRYLDDPLVDYTKHTDQVTGDGLRSLTAAGVRQYARRLWNTGPLRELGARSGWVRAAAERLVELPGPPDTELEALAAGRWTAALSRGVRTGHVPVSRALLLAGGRMVGTVG